MRSPRPLLRPACARGPVKPRCGRPGGCIRRGRLHHAARQARYRARHQRVTHQTTQPGELSDIVAPPLPDTGRGQEKPHDAEVRRRVTRPRCARFGRPGRIVRHTTLVWVQLPEPDQECMLVVFEEPDEGPIDASADTQATPGAETASAAETTG